MEPTHIGDRTLHLRAEEFELEKTSVHDRDAAIARELVETTVALEVPVLVEKLHVDERALEPPYRQARPIEGPARLVVRLSREVVAVSRRVVAYERAAIGRRAVAETRTVEASLAHEEISIERRDGASA